MRQLRKNRRDFSAVCAHYSRINSALRHAPGNGSRFECTQMHRPSAGLGVAPGDHAAALDYQRSEAGSCPSFPGRPGSAPNPGGASGLAWPSPPTAKTESKFRGK
ncbi:putative uncharacterized protein encoded by ZNF503-AS2 [Hyaena hyaena]|uniref:putative uncharacterized protein encoded by ZNF503-AS2 n=1 Tax=Hyaena hyaena TaxID=95912 RepID=UPI0019210575|nr:putative uncharacterized protein encoded by ZNF503-AS2 [Hyaena hyaena]